MTDFLIELNSDQLFVPDVYFLVFCSSTLFLWLLLLNDFLQRRSLRIIVKLNEHNNFASFWKFLLMSRSWLYFYDIFVIHTYTYFCDIPKHFLGFGLYGAFLCNNEGIQWGNFDTNRKVLFFFENRFFENFERCIYLNLWLLVFQNMLTAYLPLILSWRRSLL